MLLQANPNPPWLGKPTSTEKPGEASELTDDMSGFTADCGDAPVTGEGRWGSSGAAGVGGGDGHSASGEDGQSLDVLYTESLEDQTGVGSEIEAERSWG